MKKLLLSVLLFATSNFAVANPNTAKGTGTWLIIEGKNFQTLSGIHFKTYSMSVNGLIVGFDSQSQKCLIPEFVLEKAKVSSAEIVKMFDDKSLFIQVLCKVSGPAPESLYELAVADAVVIKPAKP